MNKALLFMDVVLEKYEAGKCPEFSVLKKNKIPLDPEERKIVLDKKAVWNLTNQPSPVSAVWKSVVNGKTWYVTNTHRAFNATQTLNGTIQRYHDFIKGTA